MFLFSKKYLFILSFSLALFSINTTIFAKDLLFHSPEQILNLSNSIKLHGSDAHSIGLMNHHGDVMVRRVSFAPNSKVESHSHPKGKVGMVTVLSGDFYLALGEKYDEKQLKQIPVGSVVIFKKDDINHFAKTGQKGATIMVVIGNEEDFAPELFK